MELISGQVGITFITLLGISPKKEEMKELKRPSGSVLSSHGGWGHGRGAGGTGRPGGRREKAWLPPAPRSNVTVNCPANLHFSCAARKVRR